jgi:uncharacterized protein (TIGR00255 family)
MTGHGAAHRQQGDASVVVEVRTVNSRYYKLALRASDGYAALEPQVDEVVRQYIRRGTVQVDLRVERQSSPDDYRINEVVLTSYFQQLQAATRRLDQPDQIRLESLLMLPGVVEEVGSRRIDADSYWPVVEPSLRMALEALGEMRAGEGRAMAADLADNCLSVRQQLDAIERQAPQVADQYRGRVAERINKLLSDWEVRVEGTELLREVALFAERSDISEELVRLRSHLSQFEEIMQSSDSSGRKLEFVTQEMFREANTIGSKANDAQIAHHVIEIKAAVERMREMIQNIE